jgi:Cu/Ag efflux protein CusF
MYKLVAPLAALALIFSIAVAQADEADGRIIAIDQTSGTIVLDDGTTFTVSEGLSMDGLEPGTEVTVSYEEMDGQLVATEVVTNN